MNERPAEDTCPECGSGSTIPIVYGYPGADLVQQVERGEIALGGCVVTGEGSDPNRRCRACDWEWCVESA